MTAKWRKISAVLLIGMYLFLGVAVELLHRHECTNVIAGEKTNATGKASKSALGNLFCTTCLFCTGQSAVLTAGPGIALLRQTQQLEAVAPETHFVRISHSFFLRAPPLL